MGSDLPRADGSQSGTASSSGTVIFGLQDIDRDTLLFDFTLRNASDSISQSGELLPGTYLIYVTASAGAQMSCVDPGTANATGQANFSLTFSGP